MSERLATKLAIVADLARLWTPVAEVRIVVHPKRTDAGYFDDLERLADVIATSEHSGKSNIYWTPNPVDPALLARAANRLERYAKVTTADADILRRRWLLLDFDPTRPAGVSSTDAEHGTALAHASKVRDYLAAAGWPEPFAADSGNGAHLLYRIDLPNDPEHRDLCQKCLLALSAECVSDGVTTDTSVFNAGRIWKAYGTLAVKGDSTPDRPHRRARILTGPSTPEVAPVALLHALAAKAPGGKATAPGPTPRGKTRQWSTDDIRGLLAAIPTHQDYDDWLRCLMAVHSVYPGPDGVALVEAWSPGSDGEVAAKFASFQRGHGVGVGTLVEIAKRHGWQPGGERKAPVPAQAASGEKTVTEHPGTPILVARHYLRLVTLAYWRGSFYLYTGASWEEQEDAAIRADFYAWSERCVWIEHTEDEGDKEHDWNPTSKTVGMVVDALKAAAHVPEHVEERDWIRYDRHYHRASEPAEVAGTITIPLANGRLHIPSVTHSDAILSTVAPTIKDHTHTYFNHSHLPIVLPLAARVESTVESIASLCVTDAPKRWLTFLESIWPDDPAPIALLQEWFGYVLSGETRYQKMLLFIGPPRAGKGTIARILGAITGKRNIAAPTMASLLETFGLQSLIGKSLAVIADARFNGRDVVTVIERLLSISGEDTQTVDRKFKQPWTGKLGVRFMLLSNELPKFADVSGAIATRFLILEATKSWLNNEDKGLEDALLLELPGILLWAIDGVLRLQQQGRFTEPASARETAQVLMDLTSPVRAFVRERLIFGPLEEIATKTLFAEWQQWCNENGNAKPGTTQSFGRDLRAAVPVKFQTSGKGAGGADGRYYHGFRLRTVNDLPAVDPEPWTSPTNGAAHPRIVDWRPAGSAWETIPADTPETVYACPPGLDFRLNPNAGTREARNPVAMEVGEL